jgi:hypothetical protein
MTRTEQLLAVIAKALVIIASDKRFDKEGYIEANEIISRIIEEEE